MKISMDYAKRRLSIVWITGTVFLFILIIIQTVFGHYGDKAKDAWSWFLPSVMPVLSLIISILISDALGKSVKQKSTDKFLFRITICLSILYLIIVSLSVFLQPFSSLAPIELLQTSNIWIAPLQGIVVGALGAFFVKS